MPILCILDTSVPHDRQQCLLQATKEAKACQSKPSQTYDDSRLRDQKTACEEGRICLNSFPRQQDQRSTRGRKQSAVALHLRAKLDCTPVHCVAKPLKDTKNTRKKRIVKNLNHTPPKNLLARLLKHSQTLKRQWTKFWDLSPRPPESV